MKLFNNTIALMNKPFPQEQCFTESLKIITFISIFIVFFLYIFQPFGIHTINDGLFLLCLGFGLVTFFVSVLYEWIIVKVFKIKGPTSNFTFIKWVFYMIGVMLLISISNFIFVRITLFDGIQWGLLPNMIRGTFAIGLFPVIIVGALALLRQERKYQKIASEINEKTKINDSGNTPNNESTIFSISSHQIRYIEAMQNYINIIYINVHGEQKEQMERATLKSVSDEYACANIARCHRSFLVNQDAIIAVSGNAQGLLLSLSDCETKVPVSRSFVPFFRND